MFLIFSSIKHLNMKIVKYVDKTVNVRVTSSTIGHVLRRLTHEIKSSNVALPND